MEGFLDESTKERKRTCKRSKKDKAKEEEIITKKRTRVRRNTLTRKEIEHLSIFDEETSQMPASCSKSSTQITSQVKQPSYSMPPPLPGYQSLTRRIEMPTSSSSYSAYSRPSQVTATATMSEISRAQEMPQTSSSYSALPRTTAASTVTLSEMNAVGMPPNAGYAVQGQAPEIPTYHTIAERTRAATKMLRSRLRYSTQQPTAVPTTHTTTESTATGIASTASRSSTPMQHSEMSASYYLRQRHQPRQGVPNLPIPTTQAMDKYWLNNSTTICITPKPPAQLKTKQEKMIKSQLVQTDLSITQMEGKLLKIIRTKQMDPTNISISIDNDDYTITYKQVQENEMNSKAIDTIMRSSDILKSELINFYVNTLQQSSAPEMPIHNTSNENNFQDQTKTSTPDFAQNVELTENPQLRHTLSGTPRANDECSSPTTNKIPARNEINQPRTNFPQEHRYQIPTIGGRQQFGNYFNPRFHQQRYHGNIGPQPRLRQRLNYPADFLRYAPFMYPRVFPSVFKQFRMPGWF